MPLDNTDYQKKFMDLYDLLPDVYKSDTNRSVFYNLFNRFLSKHDVKKIAGYIGHPNVEALVRRQIEEPTMHRQAFQLQPILNALVGSVRHHASWEDIENELRRLGVDIDEMDNWGAVELFNWAPPVDMDKLMNFDSYYWVGGQNETPEYITIRSRCAVANSLVKFWESIIDEYGAETDLVDVIPYADEDTFPVFDIETIYGDIEEIIVTGNVEEYLGNGDFVYLTETQYNDGKHQIGNIYYNIVNDNTTIEIVPGTINVDHIEHIGKLNTKFFDKIAVTGNLANLFTEDFIFFIKDSPNVQLNFSFWQVVDDSEYDESKNQTVIKINDILTDDAVGGTVSLTEQYTFALEERTCVCDNESPWDVLLWDDNPEDPVWGGEAPGNHQEWLEKISQTTPPPPYLPDANTPQWYYVDDDVLYTWDFKLELWDETMRSFSLLLDRTRGTAYWDYVSKCEAALRLESAEQWIDTNKWVHRSALDDVTNAQKAQHPIIEYEWDLQLNEWSYIDFNWKYRLGDTIEFQSSEIEPTLLELMPLPLWEADLGASNMIVLDERYGDLTDLFVPGFEFRAIDTDDIYTVIQSQYSSESSEVHYKTKVSITENISGSSLIPGVLEDEIDSTTPLMPYNTSVGDRFNGYGIHWMFDGYEEAVPTGRPPKNILMEPDITENYIEHPSGDYNYKLTPFAQIMELKTGGLSKEIYFLEDSFTGSTRTLKRKSMVGFNDVRVFINDVQQYGNFEELSETGSDGIDYVAGIQFIDTVELNLFDVIEIEVGESSQLDLGLYTVPVRTQESNNDYKRFGNTNISLIRYKRVLQNKSLTNQYPLFDIYHPSGARSHKANEIFGFRTSPEYPVNNAIGKRIVYDTGTRIYDFEQYLIDEDDGPLYAYRNFSNLENQYWFHPETESFFFWEDGTWTEKAVMGDYYREAYVDTNEPGYTEKNIEGFYWYDTANNELKKRDVESSSWEVIDDVYVGSNDHTLQTIWKGGLNHDLYVPEKVDWDGRSEDEYNTEKDAYISNMTRELMIADPDLTEEEATEQATEIWYGKESSIHSEDGTWKGDWEIPDPLYYNHMHENKKILNTAELRGHFNSVIINQDRIPGYTGEINDMFHLIPLNDVNYGVGGLIHEYNDGYDTMLSSAFVNNVTPISLIEFAEDQYSGVLINSIVDEYRENINDYLTDTSKEAQEDMTGFITESIMDGHAENDFYNFVYGDSTTYDEETDLGVKNWIATLPYINTMYAQLPNKLYDETLGITEIKHHDGHYGTYEINAAEKESITTTLINTPDSRANDTWGRQSVQRSPNNMSEFTQFFNSTVDGRNGVYWYYVPTTSFRLLFRFNVVAASPSKPLGDYEDGLLWFDTTPGQECLRQKSETDTGYPVWNVVDGLVAGDGRFHNGTNPLDISTATISAWQPFDLNDVLIDSVLGVETSLYENAPTDPLRYNPEETKAIDPVRFELYLRNAFLDYISEKEIVDPYSNVEYEADDPWTWNYKYSVPGGGYDIVGSDDQSGSFRIAGDYSTTFDPCHNLGICPSQISFYVKNSVRNDGSWKTIYSNGGEIAAEFNPSENETIIYVEGTVNPSIEGYIYQGELPGNESTGGESGSYWKGYYSDLYGTPFPHLEPWLLQGYHSKPDWWDEEYLNNDPFSWGHRRWKYKHGFEIEEYLNRETKGVTKIKGNFAENFVTGETIELDRSTNGVNDGNRGVNYLAQIIAVDQVAGSIDITGDKDEIVEVGDTISIVSFQNELIGTYTVESSAYLGPPTYSTKLYLEEHLDTKVATDSVVCTVYDISMNQTTIYYNSEFDLSAIEGRIKKGVGMWANMKDGNIPAGRPYPNGAVSITGVPKQDRELGVDIDNIERWSYFSVNIDNNTHTADAGTTLYDADALFPPYWDQGSAFTEEIISAFDQTIRSVFTDYGSEIIAPGANYNFGDNGPTEYEWRASVDFLYDNLKASYQLDPVRYVCHTFGVDFYIVGQLQVDTRTDNTFAHNRTNFHGDIIGDEALAFSGTNQWYVNFNRFLGFDSNFSDFANLWKTWTAPLTYQFATFVDTPSLELGHRSIPVTRFDYRIDAKKSIGTEDFWMDAFKIAIVNTPPDINRYENQNEWVLEVNSHLAISRNVNYYDIQNYQFYPDFENNICKLYTWKIRDVDLYNRAFEIEGNQTFAFYNGIEFKVTGSLANDDDYTVYQATYNPNTNRTIVEVQQSVRSINADGFITLTDFRRIPWETGELVYPNTTQTLPSPLLGDTGHGLQQGFIIKLNDYEFQLARTKEEALNGTAIELKSPGRGDQYIGKVHSTFKALEGQRTSTVWIHFEPDMDRLLFASLPTQIQGMQNLVNFLDGYNIFTYEEGWRINDENTHTDAYSGRLINWQTEIEKFINYCYGVRTPTYNVKDRYPITVDPPTNEFSFETGNPAFKTGDKITMLSSNGVYPDPIFRYITYFYIYLDGKRFKLAATKRDAERSKEVEILNNDGVDELWLTKPIVRSDMFPSSGINPFRSAIWFRPPRGVVSNVLTGPSEDIRSIQTIVDQYGRRFDSKNIRVFREDKRTQISVKDDLPNNVEPARYYFYPTDNDYIHIAGAHLFFDTYEHVLTFNNYTDDGDLIYDPFLGLNANKFEMLFNRQPEFTQRPNVGGYYYYDKHNRQSDLIQNMEYAVESLRYAYDTFEVLESNKLVNEVRKSLGYEGAQDYLSKMGANRKSQFIFWRGFIRHKGSVNSIHAFLNSKRIVDAKVDEFWALKVGEFGSAAEKEYPEMYVNIDDVRDNDSKFGFIETGINEICGVIKSSEAFVEVAGQFQFVLSDFATEIGNLNVYINGQKLLPTDYIQTSTKDFTITSIVLSDDDTIEAESWINQTDDRFELTRRSNIFEDPVGDEFTTDFECEIGNLNVYVNGVKQTFSDYVQTTTTSFVMFDYEYHPEDVIEAETWTISDDEYKITRTTETHVALYGQREFRLTTSTNAVCGLRNLSLSINGEKQTLSDYSQTSTNKFLLATPALAADDVIESEIWVLEKIE